MSWTELLPEQGREPAGLLDPASPASWTGPEGQPPPSHQAAQQAARTASASWRAPAALRDRPADFRRLAALGMHAAAVADCDRTPDEGPAGLMPFLIADDIRWTRSDLAWALRTADDYLYFDGAGYLLPGYMAVSLTAAELTGFAPALRAVFDDFIDQRDTPRHVRRQLAELYGTAIGRATGTLPLDLLPWSCDFGALARGKLAADLDSPPVTALLRHAMSLTSATPTKTWLREAATFPGRWPIQAVLECFSGWSGYVRFGTDELLRGLVWMLSQDRSETATDLLAETALAASGAAPDAPGSPFAPLTASAAVEALAARPGDRPAETLSHLSRTVRNRALLSRVGKVRRLRKG